MGNYQGRREDTTAGRLGGWTARQPELRKMVGNLRVRAVKGAAGRRDGGTAGQRDGGTTRRLGG